jgi:hypothetical protein
MLLWIVKFLGEGAIIDMGSNFRSGEKKGRVLRSACPLKFGDEQNDVNAFNNLNKVLCEFSLTSDLSNYDDDYVQIV